ncbi:MAG: sensor histidine kinase [Bordetella sp.]|uniref:sensor histidine kinase n=1 Tax=Bordetella sp. TaxID=28081 RepID=UPI003F7B8E01
MLLLLLLPVIVALIALDSVNDYRTLSDTTNTAYDTSLLASARMLSGGLLLDESGKLQVESSLHARLLERTQARLHRHFRIEEIEPISVGALSTRERTLAGTADLPHPPSWPAGQDGEVFFDAVYRGVPVHAVAVLRVVQRGQVSREALVVVTENAIWRSGIELRARGQEAWRDLLMLLLESVLLWVGVDWVLRPLRRLSREVTVRSPDDLTPLDDRGVPSEVAPLVQAINLHLDRHRQMLEERAQFLADASHQLRTPLAILSTQAQYALREADPARAREALQAIVEQLGRSRRLTEQLLSLAHASQAEAVYREVVDLARVCREAVMQYLPLAHEKDQDLGWVDARAAGAEAPVVAGEVELREILANLIHNAIHYSPAGARITVALAEKLDRYEVAVIDSGPGIPESLRERAFERFERAGRLGAAEGSGLGLSIARAYARCNRGGIDLRDGEVNATGGQGLCAVLWLPRSPEISAESKTENCQKNDSIAKGFSLFSEKIHWFERK